MTNELMRMSKGQQSIARNRVSENYTNRHYNKDIKLINSRQQIF